MEKQCSMADCDYIIPVKDKLQTNCEGCPGAAGTWASVRGCTCKIMLGNVVDRHFVSHLSGCWQTNPFSHVAGCHHPPNHIRSHTLFYTSWSALQVRASSANEQMIEDKSAYQFPGVFHAPRCIFYSRLYKVASLVPRPLPAFQCCTLKSERAWYLKSRARAILLRNKQLEKGDKTNRLFFAYGALNLTDILYLTCLAVGKRTLSPTLQVVIILRTTLEATRCSTLVGQHCK